MSLVSAILHDPTLQLIALVAILAALAELVVAVTAALRRGTFALDRVAQFLGGHILGRVLPIVALGALAAALEHGTATMTDIPAALTALLLSVKAAAIAGVLAYALETFGSLQTTVKPVEGE